MEQVFVTELLETWSSQSFCTELYNTDSTSEAALYSPDDLEYGDAANCRAALHRPVVESAVEPEDPVYGDAAHCRRAYHRPVASPVKEAAENAVGTSQILRTANVAETSGAASVLKEAAENTVRASQIERTANLAETPGPAPVGKVTAMILVEASHEPQQLNEIIEVEEAAQTDTELEQLYYGFLDIIQS